MSKNPKAVVVAEEDLPLGFLKEEKRAKSAVASIKKKPSKPSTDTFVSSKNFESDSTMGELKEERKSSEAPPPPPKHYPGPREKREAKAKYIASADGLKIRVTGKKESLDSLAKSLLEGIVQNEGKLEKGDYENRDSIIHYLKGEVVWTNAI